MEEWAHRTKMNDEVKKPSHAKTPRREDRKEKALCFLSASATLSVGGRMKFFCSFGKKLTDRPMVRWVNR
jgi:hypothetical protein